MKVITIFILLSSILLVGCSFLGLSGNKLAVTVKFQNDNSSSLIRDISVIAGSDKFWWSEIKAGGEESVNLYTEKDIKTNLTVIYEFDGEKKTWESEPFEENVSYQIDLIVDSKGVVSETIQKK